MYLQELWHEKCGPTDDKERPTKHKRAMDILKASNAELQAIYDIGGESSSPPSEDERVKDNGDEYAEPSVPIPKGVLGGANGGRIGTSSTVGRRWSDTLIGIGLSRIVNDPNGWFGDAWSLSRRSICCAVRWREVGQPAGSALFYVC